MTLDAAVLEELPVPPGACDVVVMAAAPAAPAAPAAALAAPAVVVVERARPSPTRLKKGSRGEEMGEEKGGGPSGGRSTGPRSSVLARSSNVC
jgi:hypothetical protein